MLPKLHVFTARFNPLRWRAPDRHFRDWATHVLDGGAELTVVEVQYGDRPFACEVKGAMHVGLRADTWSWSKEPGLNVGITRRPEAELICWQDADVFHRRADWVRETVEALQHYRVVQTWSNALDLGPNDELIQVHRAFADCYRSGDPVAHPPSAAPFWKFNGGPYDYAHSGYSWACRREMLDRTGGLFELGGMGSGDHHMALAMVGQVESSWPGGASHSYKSHLRRWQQRAQAYVNGRLGVVDGLLEHRFHGRKADRGYLSRWDMFVRHGFDPDTDLKRNTSGVLEWAGNKPELEREWDLYLRTRNEDINAL